MPCGGNWSSPLQPNSGVQVLPKMTAPALAQPRRGRCVHLPGLAGVHAVLPRSVGMPWVSIRSLMDTGTPSSGPQGSPRCQRAWLATAAWAACSGAVEAKGIQHVVVLVDAREHRAGHLHRRGLAAAVKLQHWVAVQSARSVGKAVMVGNGWVLGWRGLPGTVSRDRQVLASGGGGLTLPVASPRRPKRRPYLQMRVSSHADCRHRSGFLSWRSYASFADKAHWPAHAGAPPGLLPGRAGAGRAGRRWTMK